MSRTERTACARQTVAICDAGCYTAPEGSRVDIAAAVRRAVQGTVLYTPENPPPRTGASPGSPTRIEVTGETTFAAAARLAAKESGHIACLNFASAKNPGGGFLNGAQAQEECLARASALYPCLLAQPAYYECNRAHHSALYLDLVIWSPQVPFFRDDASRLLTSPVLASVITAPAPNAGAVAANHPKDLPLVEPTLKRRAELVLAVAAAQGVGSLVLGAWGCGVFRNDPRQVADAFKELLEQPFAGAFKRVVFAVYDNSPGRTTFDAFDAVFRNGR